MNDKKIYHLHIPRTSGYGIANALEKTFSEQGFHLHKPTQSEIFSQDTFRDNPYVSGHFASNPYFQNKNAYDVFSIIREPVQHYLSIAKYVAKSGNVEFDNYFLEEFMWGNVTPFGANELFSSSGNIQSKMLFCRLATCDESVVALREIDVASNVNLVFIESDLPEPSAISECIESMNLFCMEDREIAINWLADKVKFTHGFTLSENAYLKMNSISSQDIEISNRTKLEILERSYLDVLLYDLVKSKHR
jgi:hypothetical protein